MPSPNYSSRGGANVRLIVLHTAEGARTIESLGSWFANPANQVSSHVGIDDKPNVIGEYVKRGNKAWTAANANPVAIQAELCAFASWDSNTWNSHPNMLQNTAYWIAEEAAYFNIPLVRLSPGAAQGSGRGICEHVDLGSWGGNHTDCGKAFPIDYVIKMAGGAPPQKPFPTPPATTAPPFPYPSSHYIGVPSSSSYCHSGCYGGPDQTNTATWQRQMQYRGWTITVDGCYGPESEQVCESFQDEKKLLVDGMVGPNTWKATWEAPVT